jgi:hypothetical protein
MKALKLMMWLYGFEAFLLASYPKHKITILYLQRVSNVFRHSLSFTGVGTPKFTTWRRALQLPLAFAELKKSPDRNLVMPNSTIFRGLGSSWEAAYVLCVFWL